MENCLEGELEALTRERELRVYRRGERLYAGGDIVAGVYCIRSGKVALLKRDCDGVEWEVYSATAGDLLGMPEILEGECFPNTAVATELTTACFVPKGEFLELIQSKPMLAFDLMRRICDRIHHLENQL